MRIGYDSGPRVIILPVAHGPGIIDQTGLDTVDKYGVIVGQR